MAWTRGQTIGRGSTATVSIATINHSDQILAVKSSKLSQSQSLIHEQEILSNLNPPCPQIVTYKGCDISNENNIHVYNVFLEYAPCGTLADAIRIHGGGLDEARIRFYTREILLGLYYLHANGIVHCDIKGENILVTDNGGGVKITDFGGAKRVKSGKIGGTPVYMAPEVARGEQQGFAADIWALGCTIIEMATGRFSPWGDKLGDPVSTLYRIGFSGDSPKIPREMSKEGQDFLRMCLNVDATDRFSAAELLEHGFVKEEEHNFVLKGSDQFKPITPTSVLNEGLWRESVEENHGNCSSSYSNDRIRQLISEGCSSSSEWKSDESWIMVRGNISYSGGSGGDGGSEIIRSGEESELDIIIFPCDPTSIRETYKCSTSFNVIDDSLLKEDIILVASKCAKQISVEFIKLNIFYCMHIQVTFFASPYIKEADYNNNSM